MNAVKSPARIVHCMNAQKFTEPFIAFVDRHFEASEHRFIIREDDRFPIAPRDNLVLVPKKMSRLSLFRLYYRELRHAEKVFLHGLFAKDFVKVLALQFWFLKKCYWLIWGADLYHFVFRKRSLSANIFEAYRSFVIRRVGHLLSYIDGDIALARNWYGATGQSHSCLMYPSNLYKPLPLVDADKKRGEVVILVGNSADKRNEHLDAFKRLAPFAGHNIRVVVPLSYGNKKYAESVIGEGRRVFGDKFEAITDFMAFDDYIHLLSQVDVAIFNHRRQQAMGNIVSLLGMKKKVYIRSDITTWEFLADIGAQVFDVECFSLDTLDTNVAQRNESVIADFFSEEKLVSQYQQLFATQQSERR